MFPIFSSRLPAILAIAASLMLTGCGGGAVSSLLAEVGSGGTGAPVKVLGILTGFGSLIVDGMRRDDTIASYVSEEDQGTAMAMASTGMMLGHSLEFSVDANDKITSVMVSPELVGIVTGVGANSLTVLGTTVSVNRDTSQGPVTALLGYASAPAIQIGDRVAVYGLLKTDGQGASTLQASLIAQKPLGAGVRVSGHVSQYNATLGSFVIGNQTVTIGAAAISPAGSALSNGQLVTVWSDTPPNGSSIAATTVRIKWPVAGSGNLTVSGTVSNFTSVTSFKIRNIAVDAGNAAIMPSGATLGDGRYVVAAGKFDAASNKLTASSVTVYAPAATASVELHGTVLNFVSASSFTVRGSVVDASTASVTGGTAAELANGVFVEVFGAVADNVVKATTLRIVSVNPLNAPGGAMLDLMGTITSYDSATGQYTMAMSSGAALTGRTSPSMFYANGTAANFAVGQAVNVRGMMNNNNALTTSVVNFSQMSAMPVSGIKHMEGFAYNVTATSFMLNGLTIQLNGVPIPSGGMMGGRGMMPGARVGVDVLYSGGQYMATALSLPNG